MEAKVFNDANVEVVQPKLFASTVADELVACIEEVLSERSECAFVLAGGGTPGNIYRSLSRPPRVHDIPWEKLKLFLGDERFVSYESTQSNYRMIKETLLSHLPGAGPQLFPMNTSLSSAGQAAEEYEKTIRSNVRPGQEGFPMFDIVLLGMGTDGHIASIFPGSELVMEDKKLCREASYPQSGEDRVSLCPGAIFGAEKIIFIVSGADKAEMVKKILREKPSPEQYPASLFWGAANKTTWFIDSEAAKLL